jgi:hypothetical protein
VVEVAETSMVPAMLALVCDSKAMGRLWRPDPTGVVRPVSVTPLAIEIDEKSNTATPLETTPV